MSDVKDLEIRIKADNEQKTRATLCNEVGRILRVSGLPQHAIAELLAVNQSEVSNLINGKFGLFSESRLLRFLDKLGKDVSVVIKDTEVERFKQIYAEDFAERFSKAVEDALRLPISRTGRRNNAPED